ncbi:hydrogenase maturation protein [Roseibacterium sp. SDUM158016]|uniref:hydrogenase maturation protein n=1 Tax=Roseicyclus sediminis TaxID=2980997 RepID=UPI0021D03148|nr:hydrogenase maturation protein [Roseibacterium sp. SDUM158016]MCU4654198.1 hydrogenase maturation protein [Roseibacterium sp. SDUM158016]
MRILLLSHAFNSLTQRLWLELEADGHDLSLEYDINDATTRKAVAMFAPDLILAPFLKRAVPADVWQATRTLIVHPGPSGDKGPSALDHAVQEGRGIWGVTVLEARDEMDAGPVWAQHPFAMRAATKSSLYRREVTEAAVTAVRMALARIEEGLWPLQPANTGREDAKPPMTQAMRRIDWARMTGAEILARIRAADGQPGVRDEICGHEVWLHDAHEAGATPLARLTPGDIAGQANEAILRRTVDGAIWIGHLTIRLDGRRLKLPATRALEVLGLDAPPEIAGPDAPNGVRTERLGPVAVIRFPFLNGAMSVTRSRKLAEAIREAGDARVILLTGGPEFWCNGIDLATIEAAHSPGEESLAAIEAIDDVCLALLETSGWTMAAMAGNAGAGGVFMALAADEVAARRGVVLNPHYKNMGNLYGSEYWTYTLPRRLGPEGAAALMDTRMPLLARQAAKTGLVDRVIGGSPGDFEAAMIERAAALAAGPELDAMIGAKHARRAADQAARPLSDYRAEELRRMRLNFFGFDTSYHVARLNFITAVPKSRTPLHLARHRQVRRVAAAE